MTYRGSVKGVDTACLDAYNRHDRLMGSYPYPTPSED